MPYFPPASEGGSIAPLVVEDANTVSQRNGANKQRLQVFSIFTDVSNYSKLVVALNDAGDRWGIACQAEGTPGGEANNHFHIGGNWNGTGFGINGNQTCFFGGHVLHIGGGGGPATIEVEVAMVLKMAAGYAEIFESTAPAAPAANGCRLYVEDNGSGKTRLMVLIGAGS